jgi:four helix bundle protein
MFHADGNLRQRTFEYGRRVVLPYAALPRNKIAQVFGAQLLRSGTSVGANYREAQRGRSQAEFKAKIGDSLRETDESLYWIEHIEAENLLPSKRLAPLKDETNQLIAIFVSILKS